ncbi:MAG: putative 2-aminoethylphosphonate ABC transporter ATP-binding protein [Castellaniella sp.]|uniref:putative 2-aminoethylphosphonate ABC transporter ATP-binding protein n=1 Tax=Castellaniella sp. TaxID=1955812 RepID=UPI002A35BB68|nr:putative 2-aminoethylphosphonate ABC transporter ATP-binding protein [Castellaniella sp.]MDY0308608.1 putative 2-aminoethylphosphonate ABC transporter ATP-binding protein [Castellaniella sp.]
METPRSDVSREPALALAGLHKRYGEFTALSQVDLTVAPGEFVCLLGPSGCGKTTLLRLIAGLEAVSGGRILMRGRDVTQLPPMRRDYGIVFQNYALFPNLSVADNIAYGLRGRREDKMRRVGDLLALVGLNGAERKFPAQLSGGQQQRVALARALATNPGLLLLDEPLSALDARVREHLRREIKDLQTRLGVTTVMVTHDQEEALAMADRVVVMSRGQVEQIGTPSEIYGQPRTAFVADFIGRANWFEATVRRHGEIAVDRVTLSVAQTLPEPGSTGRVFLRPEDVRLHPVWLGGPNSALARPVKIEHLGGFCRISLTVPLWGDLPLLADVSQDELARLRLAPGQLVPVTLPADRLRMFTAEMV